MAELVTDGKGGFFYLDKKTNSWKPSPVQQNPETGQSFAFDGNDWADVTSKIPQSRPEMADRAASLDQTALSVARSKNTPFGEYLRSQAKMRRPGESEWQRGKRLGGAIGIPSQGEAAARSYVQGGTLGLGDEAVAYGTSLLGSDPGMATSGYVDQFNPGSAEAGGTPYDRNLASERWRLQAGRSEHPWTSGLSEAGGAIATTAMTPIPRLAAAPASVPGRMAAGGTLGGLEAGFYGFNTGEGDIGDRAENAAWAAPFGAAVGTAAPVVGRGIEGLFNSFNRWRLGRATGASGAAAELVGEAVTSDALVSGSGARSIRRAGEEAMLADAGPASQALLDASLQGSGMLASDAASAIRDRVTRASNSMKNTLNLYFGKPVGVGAQAKRISQRTARQREDAYNRAYDTPIDYAGPGRQIEAVLDRIPNRFKAAGLRRANEMMQAANQTNKQILFDVADDGTVTVRQPLNPMQIDYIKRGLQQGLGREVDQLGRSTADANMANTLALDLRDALGNAVPSYKTALRLGGDKIDQDNALLFGRNILSGRVTREEVKDRLKRMTDTEKKQLREGMRIDIDEKLSNIKRTITDPNTDAREALQALKDFSSRGAREKLVDILGKEKAKPFFKKMNEIASAFEVRAATSRGSQTNIRGSIQDRASSKLADGPIENVLSLQPVNAVQNTAKEILGLTKSAKSAREQKMLSEAARMLTERRGEDAVGLLRSLEGAAVDPQTAGAYGDLATKAGLLFAPTSGVVGGPSAKDMANPFLKEWQ